MLCGACDCEALPWDGSFCLGDRRRIRNSGKRIRSYANWVSQVLQTSSDSKAPNLIFDLQRSIGINGCRASSHRPF